MTDHTLSAYLLEEAEKNLEFFLDSQYDEDSPLSGAVPEPDRLCPPFPRNTSARLLEVIALWMKSESRFFGRPDIPQRALRAISYLKREQRASGNIDLWDCNFDSAPDSGFFIWDLIPLYRLLEKRPADFPVEAAKAAAAIRDEIMALILTVLEGLRTGGFHTANHRWVIASSLVAGYNLTGEAPYMDKAERYLAEGIDCDGNGEYSERSANYNAVNNNAMITLFEETGDKNYLFLAQRNLHMMRCYFEDDGSLFTGNSTRQDRGKKVFAGQYLYQYLYIAHYLNDDEARRMAVYIAQGYIQTRRKPAPACLPFLMLHPEIKIPETSGKPVILPDYNRYFKPSGIVRYKKDTFSFSLIHDSPAWLCFNSGTINGSCRISLGYFGYGNVKISKLETLESGYRFSFHADSYYYEPLDKPTGDLVNFRSEDHSVRRVQRPNYSDLEVTVSFPASGHENGIDLSFNAGGVNGVHYCFEFILPAGIPVSGDHFAVVPKPGDYILVKDGGVTLRDNTSRLGISGAFADTELFATSRNALPRDAEGFTLYMNGTTPFERKVSIFPGV